MNLIELLHIKTGVNMSQSPDLLQLQKRCYQQLHPNNEELPTKANTIGSQVKELKIICSKCTVLICCGELSMPCAFFPLHGQSTDDMWDSTHERAFACIDTTNTASRLLVTTRIKGVLSQATEVELEL